MINGFLQFLKKQKLAIQFARRDLLFLLRPLPSFQRAARLARPLVHKSSLSPAARVVDFIKTYPNSLPSVFAVELALNAGIRPPSLPVRTFEGSVIVKQALSGTDRKGDTALVLESSVRDFPNLAPEELLHTLDINMDMRLFAAELEQLNAQSSEYPGSLKFEIDWIATSQQQLVAKFTNPVTYGSQLPLSAQQNLAEIFLRLFYLKALLVLDWPAVAWNTSGQVAWLDFTSLQKVEPPQQRYALDYFRCRRVPHTPDEHHLKRALGLLLFYCPDIDILSMAEQISCCPLPEFSTDDKQLGQKTVSQLKTHYLDAGHAEPYTGTDPQTVAYLLDNKRYLRSSKFKKSSFFYWGPLLLAIYVLYHCF